MRAGIHDRSESQIFAYLHIDDCIGCGCVRLAGLRADPDKHSDDASSTRVPARPARITAAIDENQLVRLRGNVHPLAQARFDQGAVSGRATHGPHAFAVAALTGAGGRLASTPRRPVDAPVPRLPCLAHPARFAAQFQPVDADIQVITNWLSARGFHGIKVGAGRTVIEFSGNAGQVRNAFHTRNSSLSGEGCRAFPRIPAIHRFLRRFPGGSGRGVTA